MKNKIRYAEISDLMKSCKKKESTEIEGIYNYELKSVYVPVLDRKFIDKFNPKKTCISVCGNNKFEFDEDALIKNSIIQVEILKEYHRKSPHGIKEHIGEYSIFQNIEVDNFMLESYSFGKDECGDYYIILWFTPEYFVNNIYKHVFWYQKKNNIEWY